MDRIGHGVGIALNPSAWLRLIGRACGTEKGRGLWPQLCLENSSPDIYDYDGPSLVDLLWNINKLNRLQIIVTAEFKPRVMDFPLAFFLSLSLPPSPPGLFLQTQCSILSIATPLTGWVLGL